MTRRHVFAVVVVAALVVAGVALARAGLLLVADGERAAGIALTLLGAALGLGGPPLAWRSFEGSRRRRR